MNGSSFISYKMGGRLMRFKAVISLLKHIWDFPPPGMYYKNDSKRDLGLRYASRFILTSITGTMLGAFVAWLPGLGTTNRFLVGCIVLLTWVSIYFIYWLWENDQRDGD